jgi:purine-binding chemotaxis protein CheW
MAEARKRSRRPEPGEPQVPEPPAAPPVPEPLPPEAPRSSEPSVESWDSAGFVFPADDATPPPAEPAPRPAKLSLPPSGLAEDILALAASTTVQPVASAPAPVEPQPEPRAEGGPAARSHNVGFFAAPRKEEKQATEATEQIVTFFLAREEYGIDVRLVDQIIRVPEITLVPRAPDFIRGVINLRGRIIPVLDLKRKLGIGSTEAARATRIVVVKLRDRLIGLLVDGASQVQKVPLSAVEPPPDELSEIDESSIRGVAKLGSRLIILLDLARVLARELREDAS